MRAHFLRISLLVAFLAGFLDAPCQGQVTWGWSPSGSSGVAGYYVCWGTSSGVYTSTNVYPSDQSSATISNLVVDQVYFFAAQAISSNGMVSVFTSEVSFTNAAANSGSTNGPPPIPIFVATTNGGSSSVISGNGGSSSSTINTSTTNPATSLWGVPPFLTMAVSGGQPTMNIAGTVGATLIVQSTTNPLSMNNWETVTNISLTNIDAAAASNQTAQVQNLLNVAYVPASQTFPITVSNSIPFQFFRVVMPYDYVVLANIVLTGQGYAPRLILVNMPGLVDDACYVNEASSFICYINPDLQLIGSGPTIRQVANTLATTLGMNWTTASQFTFNPTNGLGQILATVVETESPSSDPVPGQVPAGPQIVIDF